MVQKDGLIIETRLASGQGRARRRLARERKERALGFQSLGLASICFSLLPWLYVASLCVYFVSLHLP